MVLTDEQKMVQKVVLDFARVEIVPVASEYEKKSKFPREIINKLSALGFMGHFIPQEYGGSGLDCLSYAIVVEEISKACASTGVIVSAHTSLACGPIVVFGNEKQKSKYLPNLASGKCIGCFALSEPESGSDAASIKTVAVKEENILYISHSQD